MFGLFVQNLCAEGASAASPSVGLSAMVPWILIFVVFYFLLIRPQQKKEKTRLDMIKNLKKGDKITTNGGIVGIVDKVDGNEVKVEIAHGVVISVLKNFVVLGSNTNTTDVAKKSEANTQTHKLKKNTVEKKNVDENNEVKKDIEKTDSANASGMEKNEEK